MRSRRGVRHLSCLYEETAGGVLIPAQNASPSLFSDSDTFFSPQMGFSDTYFSSVKLLLGFEGTNGATATTDESGSPHAASFVGNAQISTAQKKFGTSALLLDGNGDYVEFLDSPDWFFGTAPFTIEGFFRFAAAPTNCILVTQWATGGFAFWFDGGKLYFRDGGGHDSGTYTWAPTLNTWFNIAVDRDASNVLRIYVDGAMVVKTTGYNWSIPDGNGRLVVGSLIPGTFTGYDLNGYVDEVRITKGVARYASDSGFTVPTAAFPRA